MKITKKVCKLIKLDKTKYAANITKILLNMLQIHIFL